jgi:hypothetical protein
LTSASNERQIREREKRAEEDLRVNERVLRTLMEHPDGRRWVWLQLDRAKMFHADMDLDGPRMAFEKGVRWSFMPLLKSVQALTPNEFITMLSEASGRALVANPPTEELTDD